MKNTRINTFGFYIAIPFLILFCTVNTSVAQERSQAFDTERLAQIDSFMNRHIMDKHIPGASALVIRNGRIVYNKAFGYADVESGKKMRTDDIFRIASQSKAITSLAVMMLWEEGKFLLDDPVAMYIPAYGNMKVLDIYNEKDTTYTTVPANRQITIRDLLRHTSGIAYPAVFSDKRMWAIYEKAGIPSGIGSGKATLKEKMELLATLPLQHQPGEAFTYGINTDLLGYLVELWSGQPFDLFLQNRVFDPLEMTDTYFYIPKEKQSRLVTLYESTADGLEKVDHPIYEGVDPLFPNRKGTYFSGGAGLSSTTADYARFLSLFLNKGVYKGKRLLSRKTVELMLTNQLTDKMRISPYPPQPEDFRFGLGFALETEKNDYLSPFSIGTFSWGGAFNTHYWADPEENLIGILFTQEYLSPYWRIGDEFETLTYQAIAE
ncbi:beta-lactamase family protein [Sinomicrobium kalidii]|uniref:serine hydrolase domain-containing protein n=1 Tax=Sinomicrobium kalidii TaxID=2900738 RepID=UPI001E4B2F63|nr:serine hydrolase domain-containing protein [Sinomicrobium kalidii]UGU14917.1 beta-lactamase family protein [Sinomicrobium kalidii]